MTYLFDFDGTLVDSMPTFVSVMKSILDENKIPYGDDLVKIITPLGYGGTAKYFNELGVDIPEEELVLLMQKRAECEYKNTIPAKKNVVEVHSGHYHMNRHWVMNDISINIHYSY